jgi:hypothetical protein
MEERSAKHGPRLDDEMSSAAEPMERGGPETGRVEDFRLQDSPGTGRVDPSPPPDGGADLDPDGVRARSELARHLEPHVFPADRGALIASLADRPGAEETAAVLRRLPDDREFQNVQEVWEALGGGEDRPV